MKRASVTSETSAMTTKRTIQGDARMQDTRFDTPDTKPVISLRESPQDKPCIPVWEIHYYHDWLRSNREHQPVGRILEAYWNGHASKDDAVEALTRWMLRNKRMNPDDWREYADTVAETISASYIGCTVSGYLREHLNTP